MIELCLWLEHPATVSRALLIAYMLVVLAWLICLSRSHRTKPKEIPAMKPLIQSVTLAHVRACKNRASLRFALKRANQLHLVGPTITNIQRATAVNVRLINTLNLILDETGRNPHSEDPP